MKSPLYLFILKVLVLLIPIFALWYMTAAWHLKPIVLGAESLLKMLVPNAVLGLQFQETSVLLITNFGTDATGATVSPPVSDALGFTLNPLTFSYGLPLCLALLLATPLKHKVMTLGLGIVIMSVLQVMSLIVSVLKQLAFQVGPAFQTQQHLSHLGLDAIALSYQVGYLLLPMVSPLVVWALLSQSFIQTLTPALQQGALPQS